MWSYWGKSDITDRDPAVPASSAGGIVFPPHQRWDVMSFFLSLQKKIHSVSTSRKSLLLTLFPVAFRVLLFWSPYILSVQLCLPCFPCCINASFKVQLLDTSYSWIPFPDLGPEFWNNVAHWVFAPSPPTLPQNSRFQSPSVAFLTWLPVPQPCQGSSTPSSAAFSWCSWYINCEPSHEEYITLSMWKNIACMTRSEKSLPCAENFHHTLGGKVPWPCWVRKSGEMSP